MLEANTNKMTNIEKADLLAEKLRRETYHLFRNDCIIKSRRLQRELRKEGILSSVVICIGLSRGKWFGCWMTLPIVHAWGEVEGKRIETSRPLGASGIWGIVPMNIRPVIAIWI